MKLFRNNFIKLIIISIIIIIIVIIISLAQYLSNKDLNLKEDNQSNITEQYQYLNESEDNIDNREDENTIEDSIKVIDGDIYSYGNKIGFIEEDSININLDKKVFTFSGDINKIYFWEPNEKIIVFSYDNLGISSGLYRPNSGRSPIEIVYSCSGPLVDIENIRVEYCETNGVNYLTQYEFSDLSSSGFGTGGGTSWMWYKLYIKKINGVDFVLQGIIGDDWIDGPNFYTQKQNEKYNILSKKKYLDDLLRKKKVNENIENWDNFVDKL
ncbi:MAG: hypothetical protein KAT05_01080 [Spirochaetes bacterium]|nr:hypothetical protein [Spirochaetota bacterium]